MQTRTTTALLEGLLDPADEQTWRELDERFRPIVTSFARRFGLGAEDAADVAQETLARFVRSYRAGAYRRDRGRLSSWILGIARNCALDLRRAPESAPHRGLSAIGDVPDPARLEALWDEARDGEILRRAIDLLARETRFDRRTVRAFELVAFGGRAPADVARDLGMTANDVYLAKHRCLRRLRSIVGALETAYEVHR
jgi:RNA polymerase sigma-70 factor (ECF subfamily)